MPSVYAVPIQPIRVAKPDYDFFGPIAEGLEALRNRRTARDVGAALSGNDLRGASAVAFGGGDVRTGLALRQLEGQEAARAATAARTAAADREARDESARKYVLNVLASEDPDAPDFAQRWTGHLARLRAAGHPVGPEYNDPRTGYQQALTEALGPRAVIEMRNRTGANVPRPGMENLGLNEEGELEVRSPPQTGQGGPRGLVNPATFLPPNPNPDAVGPQLEQPPLPTDGGRLPPLPTPIQSNVPGTTLENRAPGRRETRDDRRQRAIEEHSEAVTNPNNTPSEVQTQQYWQGVYGRPARAGHRYDRRGREIANTEGGGDNTRPGIRGLLRAAQGNIDDVREALRKTNPASRALGQLDPTGQAIIRRVQGPLKISIRGVMHGASGAQINIPEQTEYIDQMMPNWYEPLTTIEFKLNHLENTLANINAVVAGGPAAEQRILDIRNSMRQGLGLPPLTHEQSRRRPDSRSPAPKTGSRPPLGQTKGGDRQAPRANQHLYDKYGLE